MAGYIFSLDNLESLNVYTRNGVYATKLSPPSTTWMAHHEGTFADYATMRPGDNIYFFIKRKIYGIGRLVGTPTDCKFFNFPNAATPQAFQYQGVKTHLLWDEGDFSCNQRCLCLFEPDPYFFKLGIDMDDVLSSNPEAFKMLRVFWKLSFIKFDDQENQAFRDIILKRNQAALSNPTSDNIVEFQPSHAQISNKLTPTYDFKSGMSLVLASAVDGPRVKHEMALEAGILHQLVSQVPNTRETFGAWDYLSHQVPASPFKPVEYMDKMDLFGYAYVPNFQPTKSRFLVGEIKKDAATIQDVEQSMKYVDWVKEEYCHGDYAMIHAFLVAFEFNQDVIQHSQTVRMRKYTVGVRPTQSLEWQNLKLVKYSYNPLSHRLEFEVVT